MNFLEKIKSNYIAIDNTEAFITFYKPADHKKLPCVDCETDINLFPDCHCCKLCVSYDYLPICIKCDDYDGYNEYINDVLDTIEGKNDLTK